MRTIRRVSRPLNASKWNALNELVRCYAKEKDTHLLAFNADACFAHGARASDRTRRDALVSDRYTSPTGLQARAWKMALKDAYETVNKQWAALATELRPRVAQHDRWSEAQKRYAYWLLQEPSRLAQVADGPAPVPTHFTIGGGEQRQARNYLRRVIRRKRGARPRVHVARSAAFDANMYEVFEQDGTQYLKVMSLTPRQRIVIPLTGHTPIRGNLRLVLDEERQRVEIHYTAEVKPVPPLTGEPCGLDAGVSEVFTDEVGNRYGIEFGAFLAQSSDDLCAKGRTRNKLHQIAKQAAARGDRAKSRRIRQFNLGQKKQRQYTRRQRAEMERQINTALNQVNAKRQPSVIVAERLDIRGKAKSKRISRRVSLWARRVLNERTDFKASAGGSRREQVNPAYSSQTCPVPTCGFVHPDNRRGDAFQCLHCGHADSADRVAATNLKARLVDPEIRLYTPKAQVKTILLARFNARLESPDLIGATVSGRTPAQVTARRAKRSMQSKLRFGENVGAKLG